MSKLYKFSTIWFGDKAIVVENDLGEIKPVRRVASGYHLKIKYDDTITDITDEEGEDATVLDMEGTLDSSILQMNVVLNSGLVKTIKLQGQ